MMNNKSKRKTTSTKSLTQSQKQSAIKSGTRSWALTPASRTLRASSQPSRCATVEESNDEDEVSHIGGMLDTDGDGIMEPADQSDSESENDDSKLSKSKSVFILVSHNTHV